MLRRVRGWIFAEYENVILVLAILSRSSGLVVSSYILNVDAVGSYICLRSTLSTCIFSRFALCASSCVLTEAVRVKVY